MKKVVLLLILLGFILSCTESINETELENEKITGDSNDLQSLFPAEIGKSYAYSVDTLEVQSKTFVNIGSRIANVISKDQNTNIYLCNEEYKFSDSTLQTKSVFRISANSIDFFYDSTGVSDLIPDSVEVALLLDETFKVIQFPYLDGNEWTVFKAGVNFGTFKFTIFSITGKYVGKEDLQLSGNSKTISAERFDYKIILNMPDLNNPFVSNDQTYSASIWFSPEVGLAKIEGSGMFINPISGQFFDIADSNKVMRHSLIVD